MGRGRPAIERSGGARATRERSKFSSTAESLVIVRRFRRGSAAPRPRRRPRAGALEVGVATPRPVWEISRGSHSGRPRPAPLKHIYAAFVRAGEPAHSGRPRPAPLKPPFPTRGRNWQQAHSGRPRPAPLKRECLDRELVIIPDPLRATTPGPIEAILPDRNEGNVICPLRATTPGPIEALRTRVR